MWRSNVLRVRDCSSAAWRNVRRYSSQSLPIPIDEFKKAFRGMSNGLPIGLAISGGVDSMALASLIARSQPGHASAFIVDHKVRPESSEEAEWVAEQCRVKFGMQAAVLPLTWPADFDPLDHKRFETDARILRYQALGRACRAAGLETLLVAHHADDQVETVLMRLAYSRLRSGLQGMQPVEGIPECHGMHGVSHSGGCDYSQLFPHEDGGIRILRPLLSFDKSRLVATCQEHGVTWVEDKTNHLQTYTSRNAIRHILKNYKMPAALSTESLVDLSKHMQERVKSHKAKAQRLLAGCSKRFNPQAGSLHIQFPRFQDLLKGDSEQALFKHPSSTWDISKLRDAKNTAVYLLAQAGQLVSSRENPPLGELASAVASVWPEFQNLDPSISSQEGETRTDIKTRYCVHGIWWRKWDIPSAPQQERPQNDRLAEHEWLLTRQPLATHKIESASRSIRYSPSHMIRDIQVTSEEANDRAHPDWQLFDGRWWVNIHNYTADTLILRHFTKADLDCMKPIAIARRGGPEKFIAVALSLLKPADVRFTLPALFQHDMVTGKETLIGFPTLNVSMGTLGYPKDICSWQVRYKKLSNEAGRASSHAIGLYKDSLITHAMIEKELFKFDKTYRGTTIARSSSRARFHKSTDATAKKELAESGKPCERTTRTVSSSSRKSVYSSSTNDEVQNARPTPTSESLRRQRTVPLVPTTES